MKRIMVLLVSLTFLTILSACGNNPPKSTEVVALQDVSGELTVYYVDNVQFYTNTVAQMRSQYEGLTVNDTTFDNEEALRTKIATEFAAGAGPDVFLYDFSTTTDVYRLAENNSLVDLTPYLTTDESYNPEDYYTTISNLGIIDGKQYVMPLTFNVPALFTSEEKLSENGIDLGVTPTLQSIIKAMTENTAALESGDNQFSYQSLEGNSTAASDMMLMVSGIEFVDYQNKKANFDSDEFKEVMDWYKAMHKQRSRMADPSGQQDLTKMINSATFTSFPNDVAFGTSFYSTIYGKGLSQTFQWYPLPTYHEEDKHYVVPSLYTAVSANTKNANAAYAFVRLMMDAPCYSSDVLNGRVIINSDISLNKSVVDTYLKLLETSSGIQINLGMRRLAADKMTTETKGNLKKAFDNISGGMLPNRTVTAMIFEEMTPYFEDANTYDACLTSLKNKVGIYLNE